MAEVSSEFDLDRSHKITIILADDHPLLRQALRSVLEKEADFQVIGEAGDGEEIVKLAIELVPDVVIMDISMPKINGLEATRQIKAECPRVAILVLTIHDDNEHVLSILEAGAAGYLTKSVFGEEVIHSVRGIVAGEMVLSAPIARQIMRRALKHVVKPLPLDTIETITPRELEIIELAAIGFSNRDIAQKLDLSERTVKGYFAEIFSKLNVSSRTEAVINALRAGFFTLDDLN